MKTIEKTICYVRGTFHGLYEWGNGWSAETANKWEEYWKTARGVFWKYFKKGDEEYLVTIGGAIYLHPMNFDVVLGSCGCTVNGKHFGSELEELKRLCDGAARACGGTFTMEVSEEVQHTFFTSEFNN